MKENGYKLVYQKSQEKMEEFKDKVICKLMKNDLEKIVEDNLSYWQERCAGMSFKEIQRELLTNDFTKEIEMLPKYDFNNEINLNYEFLEEGKLSLLEIRQIEVMLVEIIMEKII